MPDQQLRLVLVSADVSWVNTKQCQPTCTATHLRAHSGTAAVRELYPGNMWQIGCRLPGWQAKDSNGTPSPILCRINQAESPTV